MRLPDISCCCFCCNQVNLDVSEAITQLKKKKKMKKKKKKRKKKKKKKRKRRKNDPELSNSF